MRIITSLIFFFLIIIKAEYADVDLVPSEQVESSIKIRVSAK